MQQISILGCGWLGLPLAKALLKNDFAVNGSTTSVDKIALLKNSGINPFLISLKAEEAQGNIIGFLQDSKVLIIDIPPKLRGIEKESFIAKIENLIPFIEKSSVENVLFISSTSVYSDENTFITEDTIPDPDTESGKQLLATEMLLRKNKHFKTTILRFGGLIGEDRHPVKFLAGREDVENPGAPINLIHQEDCIGIVLRINETNSWDEVFNAVAPFHPSRKEYYTSKAIQLDLTPPIFKSSISSVSKTIDATKVINCLKYSFIRKDNF